MVDRLYDWLNDDDDDDDVLTLARFLKSGSWLQNKQVRRRRYTVVPVVRNRNDTNELWNTIPYHLQPKYTRNKSMVCIGSPEKKVKEKAKNTTEEKEKKRHRKQGKWWKEKRSKHALRAQAESLGDKVAVCWYDQSSDVSSWWTNIRTTQRRG